MLLDHGGNIKRVIDKYKLPQNKIIDFSSNINPLGITPEIKNIISRSTHLINQYPDPECKSAREALSKYWGIDKDNLLLGNGSNELIHLIPRALKSSCALIYRPTFSEYELSIRLSGAKLIFLLSKEEDGFCIDIKKIISYVPRVDLIILCNPNNPTGYLLKRNELLNLVKVCQKNKTYLLVDEVFMEFVEDEEKHSLIKEVIQQKYLLVLRSFTKFFSLPGLRAGYLVANRDIIRKINLFQPTWSVNSLAQEIIAKGYPNPSFIKKTKGYVRKEREFLFKNLKRIKGIQVFYPTANFIFCKILGKKVSVESLFLRLVKSGVLIRDCSNFKGLNNYFFRISVRRRKENLYLIECLRTIFK